MTSWPTSRPSRGWPRQLRASSSCSIAWAYLFNRTPEGLLDFRRFGGTLFHRTAFAGATTGQQLLYALDEQVRRFETVDFEDDKGRGVRGEKMVRKFEFWDFLSLVQDDQGVTRGLVAQDIKSMLIKAFPADAVCLATGGPGIIYGRSTNSVINTGTAASAVYQQGACYANGEFIQVHPTAIPGADKLRLISESARGEGGRVWVPKDPKEKRTRPATSPRRTATTSSRTSTPATATSSRATSRAASSS